MAVSLPHIELPGVAMGAFLQWAPRAVESSGLLGLELNPHSSGGASSFFGLDLYSGPPELLGKTCKQTEESKSLNGAFTDSIFKEGSDPLESFQIK